MGGFARTGSKGTCLLGILQHGMGPLLLGTHCLACLVGMSAIMSALSSQVQHMTV